MESFYVVSIFLIIFTSFKLSRCCQCLEGTVIEDYCRSDFVARVIFYNVTENQTNVVDNLEYKVKFLKTFKSSTSFDEADLKPHSIFSSQTGGACGLKLNLTYTQEWVVSGVVYEKILRIGLCGIAEVSGGKFDSFLESRFVGALNCTFFEKESALSSAYCAADFVVRISLSSNYTTLDFIRQFHVLEYKKVYRATDKFHTVNNGSVIVGRSCYLSRAKKFNQTDDIDVIAFGDISGSFDSLFVTDCAPASDWAKHLESRIKPGMLEGLDCAFAKKREDPANPYHYRSPFTSTDEVLL